MLMESSPGEGHVLERPRLGERDCIMLAPGEAMEAGVRERKASAVETRKASRYWAALHDLWGGFPLLAGHVSN